MSNNGKWACSMCTYLNDESISHCQICNTGKEQSPETINDEEFARQLQAQFDEEYQNRPPTPGSDHESQNQQQLISLGQKHQTDTEIVPSSNSNSLDPRIDSLDVRSNPTSYPSSTSNPRRSSRLVLNIVSILFLLQSQYLDLLNISCLVFLEMQQPPSFHHFYQSSMLFYEHHHTSLYF